MNSDRNASGYQEKEQLNSLDQAERLAALESLLYSVRTEKIYIPPAKSIVNLHCHSFFSYNAYGLSPAALVWMAVNNGIRNLGIVDFDVLSGVDEFLYAGEVANLRVSAGIETRVHLPEFSSYEINSPGEPGIAYHMGVGFTNGVPPQDTQPILQGLHAVSQNRIQQMIERINHHLQEIQIDYKTDVLSRTPSGNPTERHVLDAYLKKFADQHLSLNYWATKLSIEKSQLEMSYQVSTSFQTLIRSKLMKKGSIGYIAPQQQSFPSVQDFHTLIISCGAIPCFTWLDGSSEGEQRINELLEYLIDLGIGAINIIPERNWNIPDPEQKQVKLKNLYHMINLARQSELPILIGTELNSPGQKLVDDIHIPELSPFISDFLSGADFIYGHTILQKLLGLGYQSDWAKYHLPSRKQKNSFYSQIGRIIKPNSDVYAKLTELNSTLTPEEICSRIEQQITI